jgi:hypothetical protein
LQQRNHLNELENDIKKKGEKADTRLEKIRRDVLDSKFKAAEREEEERKQIAKFW